MAEKSTAVDKAADLELNITRIFDAPRSLVYQAWTHPAHLERWQGAPEGMTISSIQKDLRPGGMMKLCMRSADGQEHWLQAVYREVMENERLVFTHTWLDAAGKPGHETLVTITFADHAGKTELKLHQTGFKSVQSRDGHMGGWNSMIDRFAEYLSQVPSESDFVITRVFDAPRNLVFKAWTDPKRMAQWWGPKIFTNPVCEMDVRPGGAYRIVMRGPDGIEYPMKGVFQNIVENQQLVLTMDCSEHPAAWHDMVNPNRAKEDRNPAGIMLTTVIFEDLNGKTRLTVRMHMRSVAIRDAMAKMGMNEGWSQSLERLEQLTSGTADREIVITRVFDAPRELVWTAWTEPQHVAQWWGPKGFTTTIQEMDVRPGGAWKQVMHGPDGTDYPNESVFTEVVKPERIVFNLGGGKKGAPCLHFKMIWTFEREGPARDKTRVTIRQIYATAADREVVVKQYGAIEGAKQTLERLAEHLPKMPAETKPATKDFVITRVFDAPRDLVWKAWTDRDRLMQWFGPKGYTMAVGTLDFQPGGTFHYCMHTPDGKAMWGKFVYREIVPPEKIVLVSSFSDKKGGITRHPFSPTWPLEMLLTTTFTEHQGKTTITLRWAPLNATETEQKTFDTSHESMNMGWTGTFGQLAQYLAEAQAGGKP